MIRSRRPQALSGQEGASANRFASDDVMKSQVLLPNKVKDYIEEHNMQEVVTQALDALVKRRPADPFGELMIAFAHRAKDYPDFYGLRSLPNFPAKGSLWCEVLVTLHGTNVVIHAASLPARLFRAVPNDDDDAVPHEDGLAPCNTRLSASLEDLGSCSGAAAMLLDQVVGEKILKRLSCIDFQELHVRILDCLQDSDIILPDYQAAAGALVELLLAAAAKACNMTQLGFLQECVHHAQVTESMSIGRARSPALGMGTQCNRGSILSRATTPIRPSTPPLQPSPQLLEPMDFQEWRNEWPSLTFDVVHGGGPAPVLTSSLFRVAVALTLHSAGSSVEDPWSGEDPPVNCVELLASAAKSISEKLAARLAGDKKGPAAACVVDGTVYAPEGLAATLQLVKDVTNAAVSSQESSGVIFCGASDRWNAEDGAYEIEVGTRLNLEQLVGLYSEIFESTNGWLSALVQPFAVEDAEAGCTALADRCPSLLLLQDSGPDGKPSALSGYPGYVCHLSSWRSSSHALQMYVSQSAGLRQGAALMQLAEESTWRSIDLLLAIPTLRHIYFSNAVLKREEAWRPLADDLQDILLNAGCAQESCKSPAWSFG